MPTTAECNAILAAVKKLGGSATTAEIAELVNIKKYDVGRYIQSMRRFGMLQAKSATGTGYGLKYELKESGRA